MFYIIKSIILHVDTLGESLYPSIRVSVASTLGNFSASVSFDPNPLVNIGAFFHEYQVEPGGSRLSGATSALHGGPS